MKRVPEVIDCWWDAGSMPFAQWGFPHAEGSVKRFAERFPADFISEAIDQTRGWFYGLLAINTLLFSQTEEALEHGADLIRQHLENAGFPEEAADGGAWWNWSFAQFAASQTEKGNWSLSCSCDPVYPFVLASLYPLPYRTCICLGLILGEDGTKMSKRLKNY